jgi:hypothetical protein
MTTHVSTINTNMQQKVYRERLERQIAISSRRPITDGVGREGWPFATDRRGRGTAT